MFTDNVAPVWQFWLCLLVLLGLVVELIRKWQQCWTKPAAALYGTIIVWYVVNYISDGPAMFKALFGDSYVGFAFAQVAAFLLCYRAAVHFLVPHLVKPRAAKVPAGPDLHLLTTVTLSGWFLLFMFGVVLSGGNLIAILWPPASAEKVIMFAASGVGSGDSFLVNSCEYIYLLVCAWLGVLFVLESGPYRWALCASILVSWPYYWFGWTRNRMLALLLPMMACYYLFKPGRWVQKAVVTAVVFSAVNIWFLVVVNFRGQSSTQYLQALGQLDTKELNHVGLNMFEELCWSDALIAQGTFKSNYGSNYFANAVNFVPRALWSGKPLIGWDYAIARGMGMGMEESEGIYATISTGMIGQGVVNFGPYLGIPAAAFLMALWNCFLSRLWLQRRSFVRSMLFLVGMGLTFNLGRDVTLLVLWPVVFGYGIVRVVEAIFKPLQPRVLRVRLSPVSRPSPSTEMQTKPPLPASPTP